MTRTNPRRALPALLAIGALALAGTAYASDTSTNPNTNRHRDNHTIRLVETSAVPQLTIVDVNQPGPSAGDHVVITDGVTRQDGGPPGTLRQECTLTEASANLATSTFECSGSIALPEGTIIIQGPFTPSTPEQTQAVTGGTGQYLAAQGDALVRAEDDQITVRLLH